MSKASIAVNWPHPKLEQAFKSGRYSTNATEPWTQQLLCQLMSCYGAETVIEFGCHAGMTSAWLALALQNQGGGKLILVDTNADYCAETEKFLSEFDLPNVEVDIKNMTAMEAVDSLPRHSVDFAFLDFLVDGRQVQPVLEGLWSWWDPNGRQRMKLGGLITAHDVSKEDVAQAVVGHHGYCLDYKRMLPQGGLGFIQIPHR